MILTRAWRQRDLARCVELWEPLIGSEAASTATRARWTSQVGFIALLLWVGVVIVFQLTDLTGIPLAMLSALFWVAIIASFVRAFRMNLLASRQAAKVAGTSDKARPPVNTVRAFQRWAKSSRYSRERIL